MAHQATERNPFMLMINPEVVIAAMEKSERLSALNRQLCRPLDRTAPAGQTQAEGDDESGDDSADGTSAR
jgi:hypothetical protein